MPRFVAYVQDARRSNVRRFIVCVSPPPHARTVPTAEPRVGTRRARRLFRPSSPLSPPPQVVSLGFPQFARSASTKRKRDGDGGGGSDGSGGDGGDADLRKQRVSRPKVSAIFGGDGGGRRASAMIGQSAPSPRRTFARRFFFFLSTRSIRRISFCV